MKSTILLSIIIPTKNRYNYLRECLSSLNQINSRDFEIVIQDNSDDNRDAVEFLRALKSDKIVYNYVEESISQTENSNLAVSNSQGKYICYIGDDDSVSEHLITLAKVMDRYSILACNVNCTRFDWPDMEYKGKRRSVLSMDNRKLVVKKLDSKTMLIRSLRRGLQEIEFLPKTYHAVIAKEVLEKIQIISGSYFPGPSPDMANACASSTIIDEHYFIRLPLIISGIGYKSANGMGRRGVHKGELKDSKQLSPNVEENWNPKIPKKWIGQAIWAESGIKGLEAMKKHEYISKMNWFGLYGRILLRFPEYKPEIFSLLSSPMEYLRLAINMVLDVSRYAVNKGFEEMRKILKLQYESWDGLNLHQAVARTNDFINSKYSTEQLILEFSNAFSTSKMLREV